MRIRFSLRSLLVLQVVVGVAIILVLIAINRIRQRQQLIDSLGSKGVAFSFEEEIYSDRVSAWKRMLTAVFGNKGVYSVEMITIAGWWKNLSSLDRSDFIRLASVREVRQLSINSVPSFGDEELAAFAHLYRIELLSVDGTEVSDRGVEAISRMASLTSLSLDKTSVTDAAVPALSRMQGLEFLTITDTQLTAAGRAELHRRLPNCLIKDGFEEAENEQ